MEQQAYVEMHDLERSHWWFIARREILKAVLLQHGFKNEADRQILEIGCGTGGNLPLLLNFGQVTAVEMNNQAAEWARTENPKASVIQGLFPHNEIINRQFDLVALLDVLEHIQDEESILRAIRSSLEQKSGTLLIAVPAYMWLWSPHDDMNHHVRRYTRRRLKTVLAQNGFHVQKITYFNSLLFPLAVAQRIFSRALNRDSSLMQPQALVNRLLRNIFKSEATLLKIFNFPFGLSLVAVAKTASDDWQNK